MCAFACVRASLRTDGQFRFQSYTVPFATVDRLLNFGRPGAADLRLSLQARRRPAPIRVQQRRARVALVDIMQALLDGAQGENAPLQVVCEDPRRVLQRAHRLLLGAR